MLQGPRLSSGTICVRSLCSTSMASHMWFGSPTNPLQILSTRVGGNLAVQAAHQSCSWLTACTLHAGIDRSRVEAMELRLKQVRRRLDMTPATDSTDVCQPQVVRSSGPDMSSSLQDVLREAELYSNQVLVAHESDDFQVVERWEPVTEVDVQTPLDVYKELVGAPWLSMTGPLLLLLLLLSIRRLGHVCVAAKTELQQACLSGAAPAWRRAGVRILSISRQKIGEKLLACLCR